MAMYRRWLHSDHLGSASRATNSVGGAVSGSEMRFTPFGEPRYSGSGMPTDLRFTGQRELGRVGIGMGSLMFYGARADRLWGDF